MFCSRCGESLPVGLERCDACGAPVSGPQCLDRASAPAKGRRPKPGQGVPGVGWLLLVVGIAVGGLIGYALRSAVGPRTEGGMPTGPADVLGGAQSGGGMQAGGMGGGVGMPGGAGMPQGAMPPKDMQMVQSYKEKLAKNPNDLQANIGLGNLQYDSGQWAKAIESYTRALKVDPKNSDIRVDRAVAYLNVGQIDLSRSEIVRVTKENPKHKNAWLNLGVVALQTGDRATAISAWKQFLTLDPNGQHTASIRQQIEEMEKGP